MPDHARKTVSASEAAALFNASPWATRWMLYKRFHDGVNISAQPNGRMEWGKKLEPLIIAQAGRDLAMEVIPNLDPDGSQHYARRGQLGCSRDAIIICPDRGLGALETKCVFEYRDWMDKWGGGEFAPRHYEIQLQVQMLVGDENGEPYKWGVIPAWIAGEIHYFERQPIPELWDALKAEAKKFLEEVAAGKEPDPFGHPIEIPALGLIERIEGKTVSVADETLAQQAKAYAEAGEIVSAANKRREEIKAQLLAAAGDAETMRLPGGVTVGVKQIKRAGYTVAPSTYATVKVKYAE